MLRVLDAEAAVARAVFLFGLLEIIRQNVICLIADGVHRALQAPFAELEAFFSSLPPGRFVRRSEDRNQRPRMLRF